MTSRSERLSEFNAKLQSIRSAPVEPHRFPDFAAMEAEAAARIAAQQQQQRAAASAQPRDYVPKTAEDVRGPGAVPIKHKIKTESTDASQLSVAALGTNKVDFTKTKKNTCAEAKIEIGIRLSTGSSLFDKAKLSTAPGWTPGKF
jgi:hypothetical protein